MPSFHMYETAAEGWYCFGCRRGGGIYQLAALSTPKDVFGCRCASSEFLAVEDALHSFYEQRVEALA